MTTTCRRFYIYAYLRADGTPYYIGRGQTNRIHSRDHCVKLPPVERRVKLAVDLNHEEANDWEEALVAILGKKSDGSGCLRNLKDGGRAQGGFKHKEETKQILKEKATGRVFVVTEERKEQLTQQCLSICANPESIKKRGEARAIAAAHKMGIDPDFYLSLSASMRLLVNKRFYQHGLRGDYLFLPENVQPRTVMAAERLGVDPLWFASLSRAEKNVVTKRIKAGKTPQEVMAAFSAKLAA